MSEPLADLEYDVTDHVATITINRPDALNAIRGETFVSLMAAFDRTDADDEVRAVIVTGAGRAFSAGADLSGGSGAFAPQPTEGPKSAPRDGGGIMALRVFASKKPVIAAVNGASVGMGATMTLPMDVRLASENARYGFVFTRRGIMPEGCSSWFLPRVVGVSTAMEWMLSGRLVSAQEAHEAGLVKAVLPADDLLPAARELAQEMVANTAPVSVALTRQIMWRMLGAEHPMVAHRAESEGLASRARSGDAREGVASFLEKRAPDFPERVSADLPAIAGLADPPY
jgi:enoyl-CoA hydratase/carnithine racemase